MPGSLLYMVTTAPGLESVVESEIRTKLQGAWIRHIFRGRVLFGSTGSLEEIAELRSVDNIYAHVSWFKVGPHKADLGRLRQMVSGLDIAPSLSLVGPQSRKPKVTVSASRWGKHTYSRFDAGEVVLEALQSAHGFLRGEPSTHDLGFRLDILDDDALLSLKLTPASFRFRGSEREFSPAALRPTVAHALVWLSDPKGDDVFLDPFCGSGTIAAERCQYPSQRILASDISAQAVEASQTNLPGLVEISQQDACLLDPNLEGVSKIVTNPPWGNQISPGEDLNGLYRGFLKEAKRVLSSQGKIILLTDQAQTLTDACMSLGLDCTPLTTVSLHGLLPTVYRITL